MNEKWTTKNSLVVIAILITVVLFVFYNFIDDSPRNYTTGSYNPDQSRNPMK